MGRLSALLLVLLQTAPHDVMLRGEVVDADTGQPIACRISIRGRDGTYFFAKSASPDGSAFKYQKRVSGRKESAENHVTLSAHPFTVALTPGTYTVTVQRGKEYLPEMRPVEVGESGASIAVKLRRWIHMADRGWYSGETHVHRLADELPNLMLAEDLNVALPLTSWVTEAYTSPRSANKAGTAVLNDARVIEVDPTHVFYPRNTEYEIFRVGKKSHTLGALFILNHKTLFEEGLPPVRPVVKRAREEGALLELDKHNWPWSMMLAPVFNVDLYELANNHMWETEFAFRDFGAPAPAYMRIPLEEKGFTELGWILYTFQNYYALLDCGLRMRPTAGSASGVHPVPLGFGRVYVHLDGPFSYDAWIRGLNAGRSFVTTGPMISAVLTKERMLQIRIESAVPIRRFDIIQNGEILVGFGALNQEVPGKGYVNTEEFPIEATGSSWVAVRCFEDRDDRRIRFAHTAPLYIDVPGKPLRPRREEVEFLMGRVEQEIDRNRAVLTPEGLAEYDLALDFYRGKLKDAR